MVSIFFFFSTSPYRKLTETTNNFIMNEFFFQNFYPEGYHQEFIVWIHNLLAFLCFFSFLPLFLCIYDDCLSVKKKRRKNWSTKHQADWSKKKKKKILPVIRNHLVSIIIIIIGQIVIFDQWLWWWWCYWELIKDTHIFL